MHFLLIAPNAAQLKIVCSTFVKIKGFNETEGDFNSLNFNRVPYNAVFGLLSSLPGIITRERIYFWK